MLSPRQIEANSIEPFAIQTGYPATMFADAFHKLSMVAQLLKVAFCLDEDHIADDDTRSAYYGLAGGLLRGISDLGEQTVERIRTLADEAEDLRAKLYDAEVRACAYEAVLKHYDLQAPPPAPDLSEPADVQHEAPRAAEAG